MINGGNELDLHLVFFRHQHSFFLPIQWGSSTTKLGFNPPFNLTNLDCELCNIHYLVTSYETNPREERFHRSLSMFPMKLIVKERSHIFHILEVIGNHAITLRSLLILFNYWIRRPPSQDSSSLSMPSIINRMIISSFVYIIITHVSRYYYPAALYWRNEKMHNLIDHTNKISETRTKCQIFYPLNI